MGFFDLFKGKKEIKHQENSAKQIKQNYFLTNVEEHGFDKIEIGISGKIRVDGIIAISEFQKQAQQKGLPFSYSVMYVTLLEEGALTVPVVINFGKKACTVYFIYNEDDLLKFKDLEGHVTKTNYPNLIYFSSIPIYDGYKPKKIVEPFQLADLRVETEAQISGQYAMWWKTDDEANFTNSETNNLLTKLYEVFKGYETYMVGYLIRQTRITNDTDLKRINLPGSPINYVLNGPEDKKIILDISQEKGIRFLFPTEKTDKIYRERFLKGALVDFLSTRVFLQQNNANTDETKGPNSYDWYSFMSTIVSQKEGEGEKMDIIGGISL